MSETAVMEAPLKFDSEPTMERLSTSLGEVKAYAADVDPALWGQSPWKLTFQNGWSGSNSPGFECLVRYEFLHHCYNHPALIDDQHLWPTI